MTKAELVELIQAKRLAKDLKDGKRYAIRKRVKNGNDKAL